VADNIRNKSIVGLDIKRAASWVVVALMLFSTFSFLLVVVPGTSESTSIININETDNGYTYRWGATFPPSSIASIPNSNPTVRASDYLSGLYYMFHGYMSFDTSVLSGYTIKSVSLVVYSWGISFGGASCNVYRGDYGATLETADWNCGEDNGTFVGSFFSAQYIGTWKTIPVSSSLINMSGNTQFEFCPPSETVPPPNYDVAVADSLSGTIPYLTIELMDSGAVHISYQMLDGTTLGNGAIPQVWEYNDTSDCYMVSFDTWVGVDNVSITKVASWSVLSYTPYANSTLETGSYFNLTGVETGVTYNVYFAVPTTKQTSVTAVVYYSSTGLGVPWGTFNLRYSSGEAYNSSNATSITASLFSVIFGSNYTVAVFDWFGNDISNSSFVASSSEVLVSIPINVTEAYFQFSDGRMHRFGLETGGVFLNFSSSTLLLYQSLVYNMTVYEDQYIYELLAFTLNLSSDASQIVNINVTEKYNPTTVYFRYFDGTGTHPGEGLEWERYLLFVNGTFCPFDWFSTYNGTTLQVTVYDFFNNILYNQSLLIDTAPQYLLNISVDTYSFKVMNSQDYDPIKVKIWYAGAGTPHEFYLGAKEVVERFVKAGNYTIQVVFYNQTGTTPASVYFYKTVTTNATYLNVRGVSDIEELVETVNGVIRYQQVILQMVTPDVVFLSWMMPQVPGESPSSVIYIHPYSVITASSMLTNSYGGDLANLWGGLNLTGIQFYVPHGNDAGVTYTTIKDRLWINYAGKGDIMGFLTYDVSPVFILSNPFNMTSAIENLTTYITTGTLPAIPSYLLYYTMNATNFVDLNCENITVFSLYNISVSRESTVRSEQLFYYTYHTDTKQYVTTLTINNSLSYENWSDVYWYIGFPDNRTINPGTVSIFDLDNAVYLTSGTNYEVTSSGIRMYFAVLNSTIARTFTFSFYDTNATGPTGIPIVTVDAYTTIQHNSESFFTFTASWANSFPSVYTGQLQIKMTFTNAEHIDPASIEIFDKINNKYLTTNEFSYAGNTITIAQVSADVGTVHGFDVYFHINVKEAQDIGLFTELINILGIPISIVLILLVALVILVVWVVVISDEPWNKRTWKLLVTASYGSFVVVVIMLHYLGAIP
jgi:hypothetical protein